MSDDAAHPSTVTVRSAVAADAPVLVAIYVPVVRDTVISFEIDPPTPDVFVERVTATQRTYPWLVGECDGKVVGYVYAGTHHARAAYRWSVDTTVYIDERWRGLGVGTTLYRALFADLRDLGFVSAYAGITLPNEASVALHERLGFVAIGVFPTAGFKLGSWHDVGYWYLPLVDTPPANPSEPGRSA